VFKSGISKRRQDPSNAAPEWQARRLGWRSRELKVACPLEGAVMPNSNMLLKTLVYLRQISLFRDIQNTCK
jgi:hypothetical protein